MQAYLDIKNGEQPSQEIQYDPLPEPNSSNRPDDYGPSYPSHPFRVLRDELFLGPVPIPQTSSPIKLPLPRTDDLGDKQRNSISPTRGSADSPTERPRDHTRVRRLAQAAQWSTGGFRSETASLALLVTPALPWFLWRLQIHVVWELSWILATRLQRRRGRTKY